ncbi:amidophosphoribosyltransferase [bacterium]|nr:amidophosphoribosyltransferase [bacterium]
MSYEEGQQPKFAPQPPLRNLDASGARAGSEAGMGTDSQQSDTSRPPRRIRLYRPAGAEPAGEGILGLPLAQAALESINPYSASLSADPAWRESSEKCAIFGIYASERDVSRIAYYGLFAQQHRGQESSGIAVANGEHIVCHKDMGLVNQVFNEDILQLLKGPAAIGHNRYSTTGGSVKLNAQPLIFNKHFQRRRGLALGHNGNLVNTMELRQLLLEQFGVTPQTTSDTELIGLLLQEYFVHGSFEEALLKVCNLCRGAFCLVVLTADGVWAARDPWGVRPLCLGRLKKGYVVASENCAFPLIGAEYVREVEPGEIVRLDDKGFTSWHMERPAQRKHCMFEYFYFSRPDTLLRDSEVYSMRFRMGQQLFHEAPVEADMVIGVPESGRPAAEGFSAASGIPVREGLVKNRYVARTFIQPMQSMRAEGVRMKYSVLEQTVRGKRVVLIDDSIVRGNTTRQIPEMLREAGATEIHMRISSSPIIHPCYYGIDFGDPEELIAHRMSVAEIREHLGVDSLHYISVDGMVESTGFPKPDFCLACFNGEYPIKLPENGGPRKFMLEQESHPDQNTG